MIPAPAPAPIYHPTAQTSTTKTKEAIDQALKALRLPSMARSWHDLACEASVYGWTHERLLADLCELEVTQRTSRRLAARLSAARLPPGKRLDSFEFSLVPGIPRLRIETLCRGDWVKDGENCLLFGSSGTGKSHIAAAIGHGLIDAGFSVLYTRTTDLVQRLQAARRELALPALLAKLDRIDCLILDDLGYVRKDSAESNALFELIAERYERRSLIITCDRPFAEWTSIFADQIMTVAAIDRLVHHARIIEFGGESYRKRSAAVRIAEWAQGNPAKSTKPVIAIRQSGNAAKKP